MTHRIILSTGGTGGHVFPALSLACELKKRGFITELVTDQRGAAYQDSQYFDRVSILNLPKTLGFLGKIRQALSVICQAMRYVWEFLRDRPAMVVGFGGYTSAPVVLAGSLLRIPIIIHEQNAVLGRVNRLMGFFARRIALGMPVTRHADNEKAVFIGNPVRQSIIIQAQQRAVDTDKIKLFVFGGSQGADLFARVVPQAVGLLPVSLQAQLSIVHQVREGMQQQTRQAYGQTNAQIESIQPFFSDMPDRLCQSDLIIGRAGAMTVTEISVIGRTAIFIPLKIAMDNHQYWNVKPLVDAKAAEMILEADLTPLSLANKLQHLLESQELRQTMSEKMHEFSMLDSAEKFADLIETALEKTETK